MTKMEITQIYGLAALKDCILNQLNGCVGEFELRYFEQGYFTNIYLYGYEKNGRFRFVICDYDSLDIPDDYEGDLGDYYDACEQDLSETAFKKTEIYRMCQLGRLFFTHNV